MSIHIGAEKGDIADSVLMPGDPLRAKFIADNYLENTVRYNTVRGMYGFTGTYKGKKVSVQGSGMGIPSISIYATELIEIYGAKKLIRVGSAGSMKQNVKLRDIVIAMSASTDASFNKLRFAGMDYAATADYDLLEKAVYLAKQHNCTYHVGKILSSDIFYADNPNSWKLWADFGVLAVEMEAAALYTIAAKFGVQALTLLTISDSMVDGSASSSEDREKTFTDMMEIALNTVL
ncbi:MAG: purine-nucleoside phosphorylase [Spirochaetia bacterium]|jgi:purine-nucleoside phosphorylase|nr:purine-nucleoside phosphorylase [Spirochaetia bacterium]